MLIWGPGYVSGIATSYELDESNFGRGIIFRTRPDRSCGPPSPPCNGYRVWFPGETRPGCDVDQPPHLAPRLKKEYSNTSTPPVPLWTCSSVNLFLWAQNQAVLKHNTHLIPWIIGWIVSGYRQTLSLSSEMITSDDTDMRIPGTFFYPTPRLRKFRILDQTFQNHVNENGGRVALYRPSDTGTVR
jgi:hypothetical protein